jgi:hypothetical protein
VVFLETVTAHRYTAHVNKILLCAYFLLACVPSGFASDDAEEFQRALATASRISTLALPDQPPFHLKLSAKERNHDLPEYRTEIEVWWVGPEEWRREVRNSVFSQTVVQHGHSYSESNTADYLPFWLYELIQESVDPIPLLDHIPDDVDWTKRGCAEWQEPYKKLGDTAYVHQSICFNSDSTVRELFTPKVSAMLGGYRTFFGKKIAGSITIWPAGGSEIIATVTTLESLNPGNSILQMTNQTPFPARLRFDYIPESALDLDTQVSNPVVWPIVHNFPASGTMSVQVRLDRAGTVKEIGTIVSSNFVLTGAAREQISKWRFKPYLVEGTPVQVSTTLAVHFNARVEFLGKNGKPLPALPLLERIKLSRELSDPRYSDSSPFQMQATIEGGNGRKGVYNEVWASAGEWKRTIQLGPATFQTTCERGKTSQKLTGGKLNSTEISELLDLIVSGHFPDRHYQVYEADWGQSGVSFGDADTIRVARGQVDANNQPISGQAYWFDAAGLLRGDYEQPLTTTYSEFVLWNNKQVPRRLEVREKGVRKWLVTIDKLQPLSEISK